MRTGRRVYTMILLLVPLLIVGLGQAQAQAQPDFPALSGRVVDEANLLDAQLQRRIAQALEAHESATTEQVVVVTVPNLQGYPIEEYGYRLGREWGVGQEGSDNGALLIVALEERRVRIEVGYGLEGRLTDAQSSIIINQAITPAFRQGDYAGGIANGVSAMLQVLGGEPLQARSGPPAGQQAGQQAGQHGQERPGLSPLFLLLMIVVIGLLRGGGGRRGRRGRNVLGGILLGSAMGRGRSRGGFGGGFGGGGGGFGGGGGGFGGGGGGFGGGGASGGW